MASFSLTRRKTDPLGNDLPGILLIVKHRPGNAHASANGFLAYTLVKKQNLIL